MNLGTELCRLRSPIAGQILGRAKPMALGQESAALPEMVSDLVGTNGACVVENVKRNGAAARANWMQSIGRVLGGV